jgi:photosystem II stability/assembly factor-like uncharacterized protein
MASSARTSALRIAAVLLLLGAGAGCGRGENDSPTGLHESLTSTPGLPGEGAGLEVSLESPADGSVGVPPDAAVRLAFSRAPTDLGGVALMGPSGAVTASAAANPAGTGVTLTPDAPLADGATYRVVAAAGIPAEGASLERSRVWEFTVGTAGGAPVVAPLAPAGHDGVWAGGAWVDPLGDAADVTLTPEGGAGAVLWTIGRPTALYAAPVSLAPNTVHTLRVQAVPAGGGAAADREVHFAVGWADVTPVGLTASLRDVALLTADWAWAAGTGGTLVTTRSPVDSGTGADLDALYFVTPWEGWAAGAAGTLLHTTDGATWDPVSTFTAAGLHDVTFFGTDRGVAVGDFGRILVSGDGGATWTRAGSPVSTPLRRVACTSADVCRAVGDGGASVVTTDGGATWRSEDTGTRADLLGLAHTPDGYRWAVGEGGIVLVAGGAADAWVVRGATGQTAIREVVFADSLNGWAAGTGAFLIHTADGGLSWTAQILPAGADLKAVAARGNRRLMAVGTATDTGLPIVLATDTGGAS